jgi:hypothetical protein
MAVVFDIDFKLKEAIADLGKARAEFSALNGQYKAQIAATAKYDTAVDGLAASQRTLVGIEQQLVNQNVLLLTSFNKLATATDKADKSAEQAKSSFMSLGSAFQQAASFAAGLGIVTKIEGFFGEIIRGTAEAEKQLAILQNALGEVEGKAKFEELKAFAETTNFSFEEATSSVLKFLGQGVNPTIQQLTSLADVANAQGKSLDQLTEAILDARSGEFERLKEFGIKAKSENDKVSLTFKGVTTTVAKSDAAISDYLFSLGKLPGVSGTTAKISKTLGGELSNLGDQFTSGAVEIGKTFRGALSGAVQGLGKLITIVVSASKWLANNTGVVKGLALAYTGLKLNSIIASFGALGTSIAKATGLTTLWTAAVRYSAAASGQAAAATAADTVATNVNTVAKERATVTVRGLWAALKANPLGAIVVALGAAYAAYELLKDGLTASSRAASEFDRELSNVSDEVAMAQVAAEEAFDTLQQYTDAVNGSTEALAQNRAQQVRNNELAAQGAGLLAIDVANRKLQQQSIEAVVEQYGKYLSQQEIEALRLGQISEARAKVLAGIEQEIKLRAFEELAVEITKKRSEALLDYSKKVDLAGKSIAIGFAAIGVAPETFAKLDAATGGALTSLVEYNTGIGSARDLVNEYTRELDVLLTTIKDLKPDTTLSDFGAALGGGLGPGVSAVVKDADKIKKALDDLASDIRKFAESGRKAFEGAGVDSITAPLTRDLQGAVLTIKAAVTEFDALRKRLAEALALGADPALTNELEGGLRDFLTALVLDTKNNVVKAIGTASPALISAFDNLVEGLKTGPIADAGSLFGVLETLVAKADELAVALKSVSMISKAVAEAGVGAIEAQKKALNELTQEVEKFKERSDKALADAKLNSIADPVERETAKLLAAFDEIKKGSDELKAKLIALPEAVGTPLLAALKKAGRQDLEVLVRDFEQVILDTAPNVGKKVQGMLAELVAAVSDGNTLPLAEVEAKMMEIVALANQTGNGVKEIILKYSDGVRGLVSEVFSFLNALNDAQKAAADREVQIQKDKLAALTGVNSQASAEQVAAEEARLQALLKQQRAFVEEQRNLAIAQLVINSTLAIAKAAAEGGVAAPFTIAATLVALAAGIAAARAQAQSALPAAESGGIVGQNGLVSNVYGGGILTGKRHSQGGHLIEAEGGEGILRRAAMAKLGHKRFHELNKYGTLAPDVIAIARNPVVTTMQADMESLKQAVQDLTYAVSRLPATEVVINERGVATIANRYNANQAKIQRYAQ